MPVDDQPTSDDPSGPPDDIPERRIVGLPARSLVLGTLVSLVVAVSAGALVFLSAAPADAPADPEQPDRSIIGAPTAVAFERFDGSSANTGSYVGRPVVVNFFATWCAPCIAEMPDLEDVHQEVGDDIAFLGLNWQETPEKAREIVESTGVTYDVGIDTDGSAFAFFGATGMPTTVFIDATGAVADIHGGVLTAQQLRDRIDAAFP